MRKIFFWLLIILPLGGLLTISPLGLAGELIAAEVLSAPAAPGQFLVKFKSSQRLMITGENFQTSSAEFNQINVNYISKMDRLYREASVPKNNQMSGVYRITIKDKTRAAEFVTGLKNMPSVEYVEPNYLVKADLVPNDPQYSIQWFMEKLEMPLVWKVTRGSDQVLVAVVDSGVDSSHPELARNIWVNTGEIPANNIDDDHNGLIDDTRGAAFNSMSGTQLSSANSEDDYGHGSHVAGLIGAIGNNGRGGAGMNWSVKIIPVKILDAQGVGTVADASQGIYYAVNSGAKIINCSWGFFENSSALKEAINYALSKGVMIFASAGNYNWDNKQYPAAYDGVIGVAALDKTDHKASFSNFGSYVDIAAPGVEIYSTSKNGGYRYFSGTSQASPIAAGAAALLKAYRPDFSAADIWSILKSSARDITDPKNTGQNLIGWDQYTGCGRVDILAGLRQAGAVVDYSAPTITIITSSSGQVLGELRSLTAQVSSDYPVNEKNMKIQVDGREYRLPESALDRQNSEIKINLVQITGQTLSNGQHKIKLTIEDIRGQASSAEVVLNVAREFSLSQVINFPNPAGASGTNFRYELTQDAQVTIRIFNAAGRLIQNLEYPAGSSGGQTGINKVHWDLLDSRENLAANDVYFFLITARSTTGESRTVKGKLAILY